MVRSMPIISEDLINRFWSKVAITANPDKCWEWQGRRHYKGYGEFGSKMKAHRLSYFIANEVDPADKLVCHSCDNRCCVNPNHLWLGTDADNARDRDLKKRNNQPKGEKAHLSKLTESQVLEIRKLYSNGKYLLKDLGAMFNITKAGVWRIVKRKNWKHI